jgi:nicotinamidase/pyrazinamidase
MSPPDIRIEKSHTALIVVDMQYDFLPGGALEVHEGDRIIEPISALMESDAFSVIVATQDWHPPNHVSFASQHDRKQPLDTIELNGHDQTLWPDHCVQESTGAVLHPDLPWKRVLAMIRKGEDPMVDSYSGFRNNWAPGGGRPKTGMGGYLRERGIQTVCLCGLARDVCVRWTAEDAAAEGFTTVVLWNECRSVKPADDDSLRGALREKNIIVTESIELSR